MDTKCCLAWNIFHSRFTTMTDADDGRQFSTIRHTHTHTYIFEEKKEKDFCSRILFTSIFFMSAPSTLRFFSFTFIPLLTFSFFFFFTLFIFSSCKIGKSKIKGTHTSKKMGDNYGNDNPTEIYLKKQVGNVWFTFLGGGCQSELTRQGSD